MRIQFWKELEFHPVELTKELKQTFEDSSDVDDRLKFFGWRHFGDLGTTYSHYQSPAHCEFRAVVLDRVADQAVLVNTWMDIKDFFNKFAPELMRETVYPRLSPVREDNSPDRLN